MVAWEACTAGISLDVGYTQCLALGHQRPDHALTDRRMIQARDLLGGHSYRDEAHQMALVIYHTQGSISRICLLASQLNDTFEDNVKGKVAHQLQTGAMQCSQALFQLFSG
jgi:hypothetical protein